MSESTLLTKAKPTMKYPSENKTVEGRNKKQSKINKTKQSNNNNDDKKQTLTSHHKKLTRSERERRMKATQ